MLPRMLASRATRILLALSSALYVVGGGALAGTGPVQGLSIAWQDCRLPVGGGFSNQASGCGAVTIEFPLFPSFSLTSPIDSVYSMEMVIDVDVAADSLPAWWAMQVPPCTGNGWAADGATSLSCDDAWGGNGTGSFQGWLTRTPGGSKRHARLLVASGVLPQDAVALAAATSYTAGRILLRSVNVASCGDGCLTPACMVFNSLLIRRLHTPADEEIFITGPEAAGSDRVVWQGGSGANCAAVPTRRATWGAVKALYR